MDPSRESQHPQLHQHQQHHQQPPMMMMMMGPTHSHSQPFTSNNHNTNSNVVIPNPRFPLFNQNPSFSHHGHGHGSGGSGSGGGGGVGDGSSSAMLKTSSFSMDEGKKKRGRPRKYSPEEGNIALGLSPTPMGSNGAGTHGTNEEFNGAGGEPQQGGSVKKHRGRPPGSGKKQLDALGPGGIGFTPHVIMIRAGEDIASKIMAFSQEGPRTVCILSANGAVRNVTLRQPAAGGGSVSFEGRFEIISLSGSYSPSDSNGSRSRMGTLSISLAGADGRVLGGGVAGMLIAATPVQVIVGSFLADGKKSNSSMSISTPSPTPVPHMMNFGTSATAGSPPSHGGLSESSDDNGNSPIDHQGSGPYNNANPNMHNMQMYPPSMGWANSGMKVLHN